MPIILQVATGQREYLNIYGNDYETRDGSGLRDYIHVADLAAGHVKAVEGINSIECFEVINLGTGLGTTVFELINAFERVTNKPVPFKIARKRAGDVAISVCDTTKAIEKLNFSCIRNIEQMCADAWRWYTKNPSGYQ